MIKTQIANLPYGAELLVLQAKYGEHPQTLVYIAENEHAVACFEEMAQVFWPTCEVLSFPAWDCLPYDRVSPHHEIVGRRLETLGCLSTPPKGPRIILTTVPAMIQKIAPLSPLSAQNLTLKRGQSYSRENLESQLVHLGYHRTDTVRARGEFAARGSLLDLFPTTHERPVRVDFWGDEIENIRLFDPESQLSQGNLDLVSLGLTRDIILTPDTTKNFRQAWRQMFGAQSAQDPRYLQVSEGILPKGIEHWLPLFYPQNQMSTLLDRLSNPTLFLPHTFANLVKDAWEQIEEHYSARLAWDQKRGNVPYYPLSPDAMYLTANTLMEAIDKVSTIQFSPFNLGNAGESFTTEKRYMRPLEVNPHDPNNLAVLNSFITTQRAATRAIHIACTSSSSLERLKKLFQEHQLATNDLNFIVLRELQEGFVSPTDAIITEYDILGTVAHKQSAKRKSRSAVFDVTRLQVDDFIVHYEHGIGQYKGLLNLNVGAIPHDCLQLMYDGGDKLFIPVENLDCLTRHSSGDSQVALDKLGGSAWQSRKSKIKAQLHAIAEELFALAAQRQTQSAPVFSAQDGMYDEFCARFPYTETDDQVRAIDDILEDLATGVPMDRILCGDVGFGKTEVALRAAFAAVSQGKQVLLVVPTTLLCRQHFKTFRERFQGFPYYVTQLSRMVAKGELGGIYGGISDGSAHIVIATHAILSQHVKFHDLGLIIVDEEQHFGVVQKEKIKAIKHNVHLLSLSATPIPRTLQMGLSGIKEMSLITTPPQDRMAVHTFISPHDPLVIRHALLREHHRGGQSFYVCPYIQDLEKTKPQLKELVPELKIIEAYGKMAPQQLEDRISRFIAGEFDVLLSTTIIESGIDMPHANTMVIESADKFGLAQLYQLRGRIGRAKVRGYAYLTYNPGKILTPQAQKRLEAMQELDELGAGFRLANYDMDIRGAGNLIGQEQSGHIKEVGVELYQQMLQDAVQRVKAANNKDHEPLDDNASPQLNLGIPVIIPSTYIPDLDVRMQFYRRISKLVSEDEFALITEEMTDRFGPIPDEAKNLLTVIRFKRQAIALGLKKIDCGPKGMTLFFTEKGPVKPEKLIQFIERNAPALSVRPPNQLYYQCAVSDPVKRLARLKDLMDKLSRI